MENAEVRKPKYGRKVRKLKYGSGQKSWLLVLMIHDCVLQGCSHQVWSGQVHSACILKHATAGWGGGEGGGGVRRRAQSMYFVPFRCRRQSKTKSLATPPLFILELIIPKSKTEVKFIISLPQLNV